MRRVLLALALALSPTLLTQPANAAMCFEFTLSPSAPRVSQQTRIDVKTMWPSGVNDLALRVWAPDRSTAIVPLDRVGEERWRGSLTFDRAGTWALQAELAVPSNEYACFYQTIEVTPMPTSAVDERAVATLLVAASTLLAAVALLRARVRARRNTSRRRAARAPATAPGSSEGTAQRPRGAA